MKQITVRPTLVEYQAFKAWQITNQGSEVSESTALIELMRRYFEGGYCREPKYQLLELTDRLLKLREAV